MRLFIGIDDTDNLESRGTGHLARRLSETLGEQGFDPRGVTRHQLLVDPRIPYTSHNSSACIEVLGGDRAVEHAVGICRAVLLDRAAPGSDVGLCVATVEQVSAALVEFGGRAKRSVVARADAEVLATEAGVHLEPLTGLGIGVIGALAGVGLRAGASDGRFLWLPHLREIEGIHPAGQLRELLQVDAIETEAGRAAGGDERVDVGMWPRPLLRDGRTVLLIEEARREGCEWVVAAKERIKQLSE